MLDKTNPFKLQGTVLLLDRTSNDAALLLDSATHGCALCVDWWKQATAEERVAFVKGCGVAEVWEAIAVAIS
jgi:hypothetical protein